MSVWQITIVGFNNISKYLYRTAWSERVSVMYSYTWHHGKSRIYSVRRIVLFWISFYFLTTSLWNACPLFTRVWSLIIHVLADYFAPNGVEKSGTIFIEKYKCIDHVYGVCEYKINLKGIPEVKMNDKIKTDRNIVVAVYMIYRPTNFE